MKTVIPVLLFLGLAGGQYLETVIPLPDSIGSIYGPYCLAWDSTGNKMYVGGGGDLEGKGGVVLVDAEALQRVARVVDADSVMAICSAPDLNKVYCADYSGKRVLVIGCEADSVVAVVPVGLKLWFLCYSPQSQKVYCTGDDSVAVAIDATADTVVAVIQFSRYARGMCHVPSDNELYVASNGGVRVVDCATDSVVGLVSGLAWANVLHYYAPGDKVYAASNCDISVVDCSRDSVVAVLDIGPNLPEICSNVLAGQVYCATWDVGVNHLFVIDAAVDTVIGRIEIPEPRSMVCDSTRNRVFLSCSEGSDPGSLVFVGIAERRIIRMVETTDVPWRVFADARRSRVLSTDRRVSPVVAFDMDSGALKGVIPLAADALRMVYNYLDDRMYYDGWIRYAPVGVIDGARNCAVSILPPEGRTLSLSWSPRNDRLYQAVRSHDSVTDLVVYDCTADTVVNRVDLDPFQACFDAACLDTLRNKLFLYGKLNDDPALGVVDCVGESLLTALRLPGSVRGMSLADQHAKLYLRCGIPFDYLLVVVDCNTNSIIRILEAPGVPYSASYSPEDAALFFIGDEACLHLNVIADSVVASIPGQGGTGDPWLQYVQRFRKLYWFLPRGYLGDSVLVVDPKDDSVIGMLAVGKATTGICLDPTGRYLYCANATDSCIWVIDCELDSVVTIADVGIRNPYGPELLLNPRRGRVYMGGFLGGILPVIRCGPPGIAEGSTAVAEPRQCPTVIRGVLRVDPPPTANGSQPAEPALRRRGPTWDVGLYDASGRKVLSLQPGAHDVRRLAPGVYFVKDPDGSTLGKAVLVR